MHFCIVGVFILWTIISLFIFKLTMFSKTIAFSLLFSGLTLLTSCDLLLDGTNTRPSNPSITTTPTKPSTTTTTPSTTNSTSKITTIHTQSTNTQLVKYTAFNLSYSTKYKNPEWVSYTLTKEMVQTDGAERNSSFRKDPNVTGTAENTDYTNSGYDRGHLVPAEDMSHSEKTMYESFYMTNVSPQDPSFNRGIWKSLEDKVRKWATENKKIYVIAGPVLPKRISSTLEYIGKSGDVLVPKKFYKIIVDAENPSRKGIAFVFNNGENPKTLQHYACSIDEVESLTGLNFFPEMSAEDEALLEAKFDYSLWDTK